MSTHPDTDKVALTARNVSWDWTGLPMHYFDANPFATHYANGMNMLLPEGEVFFVDVFQQALPLIEDDAVREDVIGFIGQEGMHAHAHQLVQDYFTEQGMDNRPYVRDIEYMFQRLLGDRRLEGKKKEEWLIERLALVAAVEHVTAFLGNWVLNTPALDAAGGDPRMLDLLRWSLRYFSRKYHPKHEGSTAQAVAYLAQSPAALAADQLAQDHGLAG